MDLLLDLVKTVPSGHNAQYTHGFQCSYYGNADIKKLNAVAAPLIALHGLETLDHYALRISIQRDGDGEMTEYIIYDHDSSYIIYARPFLIV